MKKAEEALTFGEKILFTGLAALTAIGLWFFIKWILIFAGFLIFDVPDAFERIEKLEMQNAHTRLIMIETVDELNHICADIDVFCTFEIKKQI